ncbi:MAG: S8 family peptidase [Nitrospira sp.]|nr:S8 family peptidase [Nitrospira sp.]
MAANDRKTVLVTFKPKEQRPEKDKDKLAVMESCISSRVEFFNAERMSRGVAVPSGMPKEMIGYDVNEYDAPIVMAQLTEKEMEALRKNRNIEAVEDDAEAYALGTPGTLDTLSVEGQPSALAETIPSGVAQIGAPKAWECGMGHGIKCFVLDTGIDSDHPDLKDNFKGGISFVPTESSWKDFNSHGTHCAGTIAATYTGSGVVGVAPKAYLYAVKVLSASGSGQYSWIISGIDWAMKKKGPKIISMSLGGSSGSTALQKICEAANKKGVLIVAAAGNAGPPPNTVGYPAKYPTVVAVSAIGSDNVIAGFSSRGPEVEICAPGVNTLSTIPNKQYGTKSGTSMACPHVSGVAALAWGTHRFSNNKEIRSLLRATADPLGVAGRDDLYGYGRVDADGAAFHYMLPLPTYPDIP